MTVLTNNKKWHANNQTPSNQKRRAQWGDDEYRVDKSDVLKDEIHMDPKKKYILFDEHFEPQMIPKSGICFTAAELGLDEDFATTYFTKSKTQLRITQLCGQQVEVTNKDGEVLAS